MYKEIVFDAYGTLFDVFSVSQKCETVYPGNGNAISQIWRQKQLEYSWLRTLMGRYETFWLLTKDALIFALESLNLSYDDNKIEDIMSAYHTLSIYPDVMKAIEYFRPAKLAILTNGNPEMFQQLMTGSGLDKCIDYFLSADSVHLFKPRQEVYQLAVDQFHNKNTTVDKKDILFISSNAWDIAGAKAFGFTVGWINRFHKTAEQLGVTADYVVEDLVELADQIK